ncbi:Regulatory protein AtoC [Candidatus Magnetomoraceae bacterium gMMP-1]
MSSCNILLLENQYKERTALCKSLESQGYSVEAVSTTTQALKNFKIHNYDLIITKFNEAKIDGIELLKKVKKHKSDIEVIVISGSCPVETAVEAMKLGAFDFIVKPFEKGIIESVAARAIKQRLPLIDTKKKKTSTPSIITENPQMLSLMELAGTVADSKAPVLIQGESGTGKELFARFIHKQSSRCNKFFIALNCAALPDGLLESELFGHEKGAFTGAISKKPGKFELAHESTILLDEISEMSLYLQAKLLRVLQESEIDRVGGIHPIPIDARVIATTNRDIEGAIKEKTFRADLYYRLNVIPLKIPPLRERKDDIKVLVRYFIKKYNKIDGRNVKGLTESAEKTLLAMSWPGNVRELENIIERAVLLCKGDFIDKKNFFIGEEHKEPIIEKTYDNLPSVPTGSLKDMEKQMIFHTLDQTSGNRTHAAEILGISVRTLRNKLNEYRQKMQIS